MSNFGAVLHMYVYLLSGAHVHCVHVHIADGGIHLACTLICKSNLSLGTLCHVKRQDEETKKRILFNKELNEGHAKRENRLDRMTRVY